MPSLLPFRTLIAAALVIAALGAAPTPAAASTVPYRTDGDLVALASRVVHGRILDVRTEAGDNNRIYTVARVAVIEDLTGVDESIVEVRELGGRIGIDEMFVAGTPGYVAGQEVLLLLERGPRGLRNVALSFSAFHVVPEGATGAEAGVVRFAAGLDVLGEQAGSRRIRTLAEMRTIVGAIKGVRPVRPSAATAAATAGSSDAVRVQQPFTLLGNARWRQADSGTTVNWYRNTDRPQPLTSGSIDTEITTATAAWTNPTTASLILANGGTRSAGGLSVTDVTLKFYNGNTVIAAIDGSFDLASTETGNGTSGFLINVDGQQQTFLNTSVFGLAGSSNFRIALESTITNVAGGPESYLAVPGAGVIPEPETYAMLLAGLGLMGFVARRRKQKAPF